jgi:hypothetical protein
MLKVFLLAGFYVPMTVHLACADLRRAKQHRSVTEFENNNGRQLVLFSAYV